MNDQKGNDVLFFLVLCIAIVAFVSHPPRWLLILWKVKIPVLLTTTFSIAVFILKWALILGLCIFVAWSIYRITNFVNRFIQRMRFVETKLNIQRKKLKRLNNSTSGLYERISDAERAIYGLTNENKKLADSLKKLTTPTQDVVSATISEITTKKEEVACQD